MPLDRALRHLIAWQSADGPPVPDRELTVEQARERYRTAAVRQRRDDGGSGPGVSAADRLVDGPESTVLRVRIYTPASAGDRVVTFLHGGGWVLGDLDSHDGACRALAASLRAVVVAAEYRRAPEFPYPVPLHDALAAARWTARSFPGHRHVIAGDSAGGSLALGVVLTARDLHFAAQLLFYPALDPTLTIAAASAHATGYLITVEDLAWNYDQYVPDRRRRTEPAVDLLAADLRGMPPTVLATAEFDPLSAEGAQLAAKLRAAGVVVRHLLGEGLVHGYLLMQGITPAAATGARQAIRELDLLLAGENSASSGTFLQDAEQSSA